MMKRAIRKMLAFAFTLCLLAAMATAVSAEEVTAADYQPVIPVLDLVASAAICASDFPTVISDADSTLDLTYVTFFFTNGLLADPALGITQEMLTDTAQQEQFLSGIFSAQLPALEAITPPETVEDYIGFLPMIREEADNGMFYLIGELYRGSMPIAQMTTEDYKTLRWEDRAIYTLKEDAAAMGGYRVEGFSVGSELLMELQLQEYTNTILVEYINSKLGFSLLYPSLFQEANFTENASGASAVTADGSASFMVKRMANETGVSLSEYAITAAETAADARVSVNEMFEYATVAYETADGNSVFAIYMVTDDSIYMAQLIYPTSQSIVYNMYTMYLENSFVVDEVSVG